LVRWRARLDEAMHDEEQRRDDFYSFFGAAYHLADWIKTDDIVEQTVRDQAWSIRHTGSIGLTGDVTNGHKHLKRQPGRENVDGLNAFVDRQPDRARI
jgi:hypothetical protein